MQLISKLIDSKGREIDRPSAFEGSISFDAKTGEAHAWSEDGKMLLAEMHNARVVWVTRHGMRLQGMEPLNLRGATRRYAAMEWHMAFEVGTAQSTEMSRAGLGNQAVLAIPEVLQTAKNTPPSSDLCAEARRVIRSLVDVLDSDLHPADHSRASRLARSKSSSVRQASDVLDMLLGGYGQLIRERMNIAQADWPAHEFCVLAQRLAFASMDGGDAR